MNTPELRFPEFNEEWVTMKLGNLGKFLGGGTPSTKNSNFWNGDIPWISSSDLTEENIYQINSVRFITKDAISQSATKLIPANSILIVSRVGVGKVAVNKTELCTSQDFTNLVACTENVVFLAYLIKVETKCLLEFNQGTSIKGFVKSDLVALELKLPLIPEQTRIAAFLSAIDEKLSQLKKKKTLLEQYKKGVMQKLYSQEIRFKDANGKEFPDWDTKPLGELLDYEQPTKYIVESTEYDKSYKIPVLTAGKTFILGYTDETFGIFENSLPVIIFDDFTTAIKLVDFPFKVKSSAMKILHPQSNGNIYFVYEAIKLIDYIVGGHERHWISKYSKLEISVPCTEEQEKISKYLNAINKKIDHCNMQIEKTELWKKGLLQKMFV